MKNRGMTFVLFISLLWGMTGCVQKPKYGQKVAVPHVVCRKEVIPTELMGWIGQSRRDVNHFTYWVGEFRYYVITYGKHPGKGYKVTLDRMVMDQGHIYITTTLVGIPKEKQRQGYSYPYIVIKTKDYQKDVVFF